MRRPAGREDSLRISRRQFLAPLVLAAFRGRAALASQAADPSGDRLMKVADLSALQSLLTANEAFYVRNHFATPQLYLTDWKLQISGRAGSHREVSYTELLRQRTRTLTVTLECAGNGVGSGGISTAAWTGILLPTLLKQAGLSPATKHIRFIGADRGLEIPSQPALAYARSIPLAKALDPDTLLAWQMNGSPLPPEHGYPLRVIVPGWYGMDSVKWLTRIEALDHTDSSLFMTQRYVAVRLQAVGSERRSITRMRVKSLITQPHEGEVLTRGTHTIGGVAWAGENRVVRVQVSTNGGQDWAPATLKQDVGPYSWALWTYPWDARAPGAYTIVARATDDQGITQPGSRDSLRIDSYELNSCHSVPCQVC
jgi:DMSO/TMAO reductase YedYZ molybdopterin-dependent catalytic subunit